MKTEENDHRRYYPKRILKSLHIIINDSYLRQRGNWMNPITEDRTADTRGTRIKMIRRSCIVYRELISHYEIGKLLCLYQNKGKRCENEK